MSKKSDVLLGDLLVQSGIVSRQEFADAMPISMKTGLPVGRILVASGSIKDSALQSALFAQSMLRDRVLNKELALQALRMVAMHNTSLDQELATLGWKSEAYEMTNRLGQLFLEAGIINTDQLEAGLEAFYTAGLPLARVLVLQDIITPMIAHSALTAQKLVRDGSISREQAIEALKSSRTNSISVEESLNTHGYYSLEPENAIRLGELLVLANVVSELELLDCVESSIVNDQTIGETFANQGRISRKLLDEALELQQMTTTGHLEPRQAAEALRRINQAGLTFELALREVTGTPAERAEMLGLATLADSEIKAPNHDRAVAATPAHGSSSQPAAPAKQPAKPKQAQEDYLSVFEAASRMNTTSKALIKKIKKGQVDGFQKNGEWYVPMSVFEDPKMVSAAKRLTAATTKASIAQAVAEHFASAAAQKSDVLPSGNVEAIATAAQQIAEAAIAKATAKSNEKAAARAAEAATAEPVSVPAIEAKQPVPEPKLKSQPAASPKSKPEPEPAPQSEPEPEDDTAAQESEDTQEPDGQDDSAEQPNTDTQDNVVESDDDTAQDDDLSLPPGVIAADYDMTAIHEAWESQVSDMEEVAYEEQPQEQEVEQDQVYVNEAYLQAAQSSYITNAIQSEHAVAMVAQHLALIEKLAARVEALSYKAGFLEGQLALKKEQARSRNGEA